jgi:hypothetical protein
LLEQETTINESKDIMTHQEKDQGQTEKLQHLQHDLEEFIKESKKKEQFLRKKKLKTEKEVENWINKYDAEMTEKANEISAISVFLCCTRPRQQILMNVLE